MQKKCIIELQNYYILPRRPLFHLRPAVERVFLFLPYSQKVNLPVFKAVEASAEYLHVAVCSYNHKSAHLS